MRALSPPNKKHVAFIVMSADSTYHLNLLSSLFKTKSTNGKLVVWGPVVWIPRIPLNERDCYLGEPLEPQSTGPQTI